MKNIIVYSVPLLFSIATGLALANSPIPGTVAFNDQNKAHWAELCVQADQFSSNDFAYCIGGNTGRPVTFSSNLTIRLIHLIGPNGDDLIVYGPHYQPYPIPHLHQCLRIQAPQTWTFTANADGKTFQVQCPKF